LNRSILLLSLAAFASAASMRVTDALLPRIAADYHVGIAAAATVITTFSVAYGTMQLLFGPLGDRFGKLRMIAVGAGGGAVASMACYFVGDFHGLLVARVFAGGFCACIIPLAMAWIGDAVDYEQRQPVLARFLLGQILGVAGGSALGGFAAETATWRWPFALLGAWLACACLLLAAASRSDPVPRVASGRHFFHDLAHVLAVRWARAVVASVFAEGMVVFGALAFIPTHLHFARGMELSHAGLALVAFALGGVLFAMFARRAVHRMGETGLAVGGTLFLAAGLALVAWTPALWVAPAGCFAAGLGFYMLHNTMQTNATQMAPQRRGAAMALFASLLFLGQSVGVACAGALAERAGTAVVLLGAAALVIPVGLTFARLRIFHARAGAP
jgi:predicted MFS family arabinose efflux permease